MEPQEAWLVISTRAVLPGRSSAQRHLCADQYTYDGNPAPFNRHRVTYLTRLAHVGGLSAAAPDFAQKTAQPSPSALACVLSTSWTRHMHQHHGIKPVSQVRPQRVCVHEHRLQLALRAPPQRLRRRRWVQPARHRVSDVFAVARCTSREHSDSGITAEPFRLDRRKTGAVSAHVRGLNKRESILH